MAKNALNGVLHHIRMAATARVLSDRELLERFIDTRDEAAFTALVHKHGHMVLGVCRRGLPNSQDAEDAFQAAFLVLAAKAASVRKKSSLGSWLFGVARLVVAAQKRDHARRKVRELRLDMHESEDPATEVARSEILTILDEELERLPAHYREALILCYLECMNRDKAAQQLGLTPDVLRGRLERAREKLRVYLRKRGVALAVAISSATASGDSVATAALPPTIVMSSTKAALLLVAGGTSPAGIVSSKTLALTNEVIATIVTNKVIASASWTFAAIAISTLAVTLAYGAQETQPKPPETPKEQEKPAVKKTFVTGVRVVIVSEHVKEAYGGCWIKVLQERNGANILNLAEGNRSCIRRCCAR